MKDDKLYLLHVKQAIGKIFKYAESGKEAFFADEKTQDAVIRNIEIIGEAVKNISADLKTSYPEIPWRRIAGMRDKMIHEYFGVNLDLIWETVERDLPELLKNTKNILKEIFF